MRLAVAKVDAALPHRILPGPPPQMPPAQSLLQQSPLSRQGRPCWVQAAAPARGARPAKRPTPRLLANCLTRARRDCWVAHPLVSESKRSPSTRAPPPDGAGQAPTRPQLRRELGYRVVPSRAGPTSVKMRPSPSLERAKVAGASRWGYRRQRARACGRRCRSAPRPVRSIPTLFRPRPSASTKVGGDRRRADCASRRGRSEGAAGRRPTLRLLAERRRRRVVDG